MVQASIPITETLFATGFEWQDYVAQMTVNRQQIEAHFAELALSIDDEQDLREAVSRYGGEIFVAAMTEDWCGDSPTCP
ncbi:MAG: thioredoxin family protein [Chloroflexi bacterium]|nr:thioredoxin family protein [Chloroflexota bacterium]